MTIEVMILVPILILQVFLLPSTVAWVTNNWVNSRRTIALQEAADHLGSTIQQTFFALNHETMTAETFIYKSNLPPFIENCPYTANATLTKTSDPALNSSKILNIAFRLEGTETTADSSAILGQNVIWLESKFTSNSTNAGIIAQKDMNGTIILSFAG